MIIERGRNIAAPTWTGKNLFVEGTSGVRELWLASRTARKKINSSVHETAHGVADCPCQLG